MSALPFVQKRALPVRRRRCGRSVRFCSRGPLSRAPY